MRRCCGGGGAGLGRVLGEGARAGGRARWSGIRTPRTQGAGAGLERETAAGRAPADRSVGLESRRPPPGPESKCYIKYRAVPTRGRAIARALPAWALPWLWTRLRADREGRRRGVSCGEEEGGREDRSRPGARLCCARWARAGLRPERSGAGEGPAVLPETQAAPSGEEAEPACPPGPVGCWGNFAARSGGSVLNVHGRSEFTLVYRTAQQGNGRVGGGGELPLRPTHRDLPRKAPLRALCEMQLRSSVYRGVINILRNVPPLRRYDWSFHPPWNVLISVLRCHWGTGCTGAGLARGRAPRRRFTESSGRGGARSASLIGWRDRGRFIAAGPWRLWPPGGRRDRLPGAARAALATSGISGRQILKELDDYYEKFKRETDGTQKRRVLHCIQRALIRSQELGDEKIQIQSPGMSLSLTPSQQQRTERKGMYIHIVGLSSCIHGEPPDAREMLPHCPRLTLATTSDWLMDPSQYSFLLYNQHNGRYRTDTASELSGL
ncbi:hypothetical protein NN561_005127 [Cricetulus griseus]